MNTRTSKLIFPAILFLFACLIAFGENGPTPKIVVGSSGISDGSVTNAKLAEPVSVANGGTGATTAAAGLAALGGASLNGSSTVNFAAKAAVVDTLQVRTSGKFLATTTVTIAAGNSLQITGLGTFATGAGGLLVVYAGGLGAGATFNVFSNQTTSEVAVVGGHVFFTATKDAANRVNVYTQSDILYVQNNTAFSSQFKLSYIGVN